MSQTARSQAVTFVICEQYGNETQELHVVGERDEQDQCSLSLHMMSDGWKLDLDEVDYFIESLADTMNQVKRTLEELRQQVSLP